MDTKKSKQYYTIGYCGIGCGLCPRFNSAGASACQGCCGRKFKEKHPSCGVVTCCVIKNGYETCAECINYPCQKFMTKSAGHDSFVTHKMAHSNLEFIKKEGITEFINQQQIRINILSYFLQECNDGRSKNFYCLSCALLPIDKLQECQPTDRYHGASEP